MRFCGCRRRTRANTAARWQAYTPAYSRSASGQLECTCWWSSDKSSWPDVGGFGATTEPQPIKRILKLLEYYDGAGALLTASSKTHARDDLGLIGDHGYSLVEVELDIAGTGIDLLQLRNPWADTEWKGEWSRRSKLWDANPKVKAALRRGRARGRLLLDDADRLRQAL